MKKKSSTATATAGRLNLKTQIIRRLTDPQSGAIIGGWVTHGTAGW